MWVTALDYVVRWCGSDIAHWPCEKTNGGKGHLPHGRRLLATAVAPHRHLRTARGRCGSLLLHRGGLSPLTPCRFHRRTQNSKLATAYPSDADMLLAPHSTHTKCHGT